MSDKEPVNKENKYGQNFHNIFCYCHQSYDPEDPRSMVKCVICEDWFHEECITAEVMASNQDFVCRDCTAQFPVLQKYVGNGFVTGNADALEKKLSGDSGPHHGENGGGELENKDDGPQRKRQKLTEDASATPTTSATTSATATAPPVEGSCLITLVPDDSRRTELFCAKGWRTALCTCFACGLLFDRLGLEFLVKEDEGKPPFAQPPLGDDEDDGEEPVDVVGEGLATTAGETSLFEGGLRALHTVPQEMAVNMVAATNTLTEKLKEYLRPMAEQGHVVTKADIDAFFAELTRQRKTGHF